MSDSGSILLRRGPTSDRLEFVPLNGEAIFDTDQKVLYLGDGQTSGGNAAFNDKIVVDNDGNISAIKLSDPSGVRPSPLAGLIRYNNDTNTLEYNDGSDYNLILASPFNSVTNVLYVSPNGKDDDTFQEKKGRTPGTAFKTLNRACREAEAIIKNSAKGLGPYQKFITFDNGAGQENSVIDNIVDNAPYKNIQITNGGTSLDATTELRSGFRVIGQISGAIGIIEEYNVPGGLTDQLIVDVESGEFQIGEALKFGSAIPSTPYVSGVQNIPEITIRVETGIYYEDLPIRVPVNTSIKGDEFRRSIIRPKPGMSNSPYADIGFKRDAVHLEDYSGSEDRVFGRHYTTDYSARIYPFIANEGGYTTEVQIIRSAKSTLIDQTIAFIQQNYPSLDYDEAKCRRDTGLIIDALVFDLEYGEYNGILNAGLAYYGQSAYLLSDQVTPTAASIDNLASSINNLIASSEVQAIVTNYVGGVAEIIRGNNFNPPKNNDEVDVFLMNDATIIRNITVQQHGGFMEVLDPVGQIKTRSPYTQTASSFSKSKAPEVSFAGGMFVDGFCGNLDARFVQANSEIEIIIDSIDREPQAPTSFYVDGSRFQINKVDTVGVSTGQFRVLLDETTPWNTSYYQIVNSGDPLPLTPFDIEVLTAGNISMLSNDFTQINDLGYGLYVTNGARSEAVSVFTYYCHIAYLSEAGADIRSLNGSCGYGNFALVARGSDPLETSDEVNLSEDTLQVATTNSAGAFTGSNEEGDLQLFVDSFDYLPFNVSEIEIDHNGATNSDGDAFEIVRYGITGFTETSSPGVIQLNLNSSGNNDTSTTGLKTDVPDNTDIVIRNGQVVQLLNVIDVNPTRPSTALVYQDDPNTVYRVLAYDTQDLPDNQARVTLRETYDYVKAIVDTTAGSVPGSGQSGDTTIRLEVDLDNNEETRIESAIASGSPYIFGFNGVIHNITAYRNKVETGQPYAEIDISPALTKSLAGFTETVTLRAGPQAGQAADITVGISTLRATSHDMLDIGTGSFQTTNYPSEIFGAPEIQKDQAREVVEEDKGRVFFVTSDQDGNFRVGDFFKVDQGTGTVTFAASIALSNLDGIGFKRGVAISEFSTDDSMTDSASDTVPTESAVLNYVGRRLGLTDSNVERIDKIGNGFLDLGGVQNMVGNLNMNSNTINNLLAPTSENQAANKAYVDGKTFEVNGESSAVDGSITLDTDLVTQGENNLYYASSLFDADLATKTTTDLTEGSNLYFTEERVDDRVNTLLSAGTNISLTYDDDGNSLTINVDNDGGLDLSNNTTDNLSEGENNLYYTNERVDDRVAALLTEGTNISLSYNDADNTLTIEADPIGGYDLSQNDSDDITEGTDNLYFTAERVDDRVNSLLLAGTNISIIYDDDGNTLTIAADSTDGFDLSNNTTDNLTEGSSNLYYTDARVDAQILNNTTDNLSEGDNNLYYTNERVDDRINDLLTAGTNISFTYDDEENTFTINVDSTDGLDFSNNDTDNLTEGSTNEYFTTARARDSFSAGTGITITDGEIATTITQYTDTDAQAAITAGTGITVTDGEVATTITQYTDADAQAAITGGTGVTVTDGEVSIGQDVNTDSDVTFNDVTIDGDLTVNGTTTTIATETITLDDNIIVLNNNKTGAPGNETAGIEIERGSGDNVQLRWNDTDDVWQLTTNGTDYDAIATIGDVSDAAENDFVNSASFDTDSGVLTLTRASTTEITVDLDDRYVLLGGDTITGDLSINGSLTTTGIVPDGNNTRNIGSNGTRYNTVYATTFNGTATTATYADLAEIYESDKNYAPGTVVTFGGSKEVTECLEIADTRVAGVVSTNPAYLMNTNCKGVAVALLGKIPCKVIGRVAKGDMMVSAGNGYAKATDKFIGGAVIGKAIENKHYEEAGVINIVVGRQ